MCAMTSDEVRIPGNQFVWLFIAWLGMAFLWIGRGGFAWGLAGLAVPIFIFMMVVARRTGIRIGPQRIEVLRDLRRTIISPQSLEQMLVQRRGARLVALHFRADGNVIHLLPGMHTSTQLARIVEEIRRVSPQVNIIEIESNRFFTALPEEWR